MLVGVLNEFDTVSSLHHDFWRKNFEDSPSVNGLVYGSIAI